MTPVPPNPPPPRVSGRIAIVDDNPDDVFILQRQLRQLGLACPISTFSDGHDAMAFLRHIAETEGRCCLPEMVFLDINMPGATGFSVLCWLREQESLRNLRVVILSGTCDPGDVALATALTADAYVTKQPSLDQLSQILRRFVPDLLPAGERAELQPVLAGPASTHPFARR